VIGAVNYITSNLFFRFTKPGPGCPRVSTGGGMGLPYLGLGHRGS
jgi:hypothetical protein